jgi:hypothetical protein
MGQTADLLRRTQAISYMEVTSDQSHKVRFHHDLAHIAAITRKTTTVAKWLIMTDVIGTPATTMGQGMIMTRK